MDLNIKILIIILHVHVLGYLSQYIAISKQQDSLHDFLLSLNLTQLYFSVLEFHEIKLKIVFFIDSDILH